MHNQVIIAIVLIGFLLIFRIISNTYHITIAGVATVSWKEIAITFLKLPASIH